MSMLVEWTVLIGMLVGFALGSCCIYWVKVKPCPKRARLGRRLFVVTLLSLGAMALFAAIAHAEGLAPLGLMSGLLIVGMLWESPAPAIQDDSTHIM